MASRFAVCETPDCSEYCRPVPIKYGVRAICASCEGESRIVDVDDMTVVGKVLDDRGSGAFESVQDIMERMLSSAGVEYHGLSGQGVDRYAPSMVFGGPPRNTLKSCEFPRLLDAPQVEAILGEFADWYESSIGTKITRDQIDLFIEMRFNRSRDKE